MYGVGLASFIHGTGLYLVPASPFDVGGPLRLRAPKFATGLARQHRECAMAGTITTIYRCEEPLPIRELRVTYHACPARARWGQIDGSVAHPPEYLFGGAPAIGGCPGMHSAIRCRATGRQLPYSSFSLGQLARGQGEVSVLRNDFHLLSH